MNSMKRVSTSTTIDLFLEGVASRLATAIYMLHGNDSSSPNLEYESYRPYIIYG